MTLKVWVLARTDSELSIVRSYVEKADLEADIRLLRRLEPNGVFYQDECELFGSDRINQAPQDVDIQSGNGEGRINRVTQLAEELGRLRISTLQARRILLAMSYALRNRGWSAAAGDAMTLHKHLGLYRLNSDVQAPDLAFSATENRINRGSEETAIAQESDLEPATRTALSESLERADTDIGRLTAALDAQKQRVAVLEGDNQRLEQAALKQIEELREEIASHKAEMAAGVNTRDVLRAEVERLKTIASDLEDDSTDWQTVNRQNSTALKEAHKTLAELREELASYKADAVQRAASNVSGRLDLSIELSKAKQQITELQEDLETALSRIERINGEAATLRDAANEAIDKAKAREKAAQDELAKLRELFDQKMGHIQRMRIFTDQQHARIERMTKEARDYSTSVNAELAGVRAELTREREQRRRVENDNRELTSKWTQAMGEAAAVQAVLDGHPAQNTHPSAKDPAVTGPIPKLPLEDFPS